MLLLPLVFASRHACAQRTSTLATIEQGFLHPPDEAKPMVRWWWFGAAVTEPEILHELQQMRADGIGGVELAFVYPEVLDDPAHGVKNLPFLSAEMLSAVRYAQAQGRRLGLRIDVTLCSGWPYGGPAITLADAATRLRTAEVPVPSQAVSVAAPVLSAGERVLSAVLVSSSPTPEAKQTHGSEAAMWDLASAQPFDPAKLTCLPSSTPRTAVFFIQSHTRQQVKRAAVGAEGFVLDPFSRSAVATHLKAVGEPLLSAFGSTPPYAIFSDSLEAYGADWTPNLPAEFLKRRGYDLLPHLPELFAGGTPAADTIRHDYGRTLTELVDENYLTQINDWATAHGTKFRSQTYGEPAVSLASQRLVALPEGEGPQWRAFSTLRWATSANHLFGTVVSSGETFTWLHSPVFRATPLDMKAEADIDFVMGENQLIFHGWPYSPPANELATGDPGWSLYAAAVFNDHNPWHPVMPWVTAYITRISWLLRQGEPANQVAVLLPTDDAWASFAPGKVTVSGVMSKLITPSLMSAILSAGYNVDYIDADTINRLGLGTHSILIVPPTTRIPAETLAKMAAFTSSGGKVIYVGRKPTLDADGNALTASALPDGGFAASEATLGETLHAAARQDLLITSSDPVANKALGYIRRKLPNADVYFVTNTSHQDVEARLMPSTRFEVGFELNPETGLREKGFEYSLLTVKLAPYQSKVLVFDTLNAGPVQPLAPRTKATIDLSGNWVVTFPALSKSITAANLTDWIADPATLHYSGEGIYTRDFTLNSLPKQSVYLEVTGGIALPGSPDSSAPLHEVMKNGMPDPLVTRTGPGMHAYYDPPIREAALVFINGKEAGALWHPPYRLDVTKLLKPGTNQIEIRVYNTALNAWSALPPRDYSPLKAKYGDRFQMQDLDKVKPIPSGISGTIRLIYQDNHP